MKIRTHKANILLLCIVALTAWVANSCDDNSMGGDTLLGFPTDTLFVEAEPGDTVDVSFSVGYDWRILSDKNWCTVGSADGEKNAYGQAGDNTVQFVISESGDKFVADTAEITLYMNSESRTIAFITCSAEEYLLKVRDEQGEYVTGGTITVDTTGKKVLYLESNFSLSFLTVNWPTEWLSYDLNDTVSTITLEVKEEFLKYPVDNVEDSLHLSGKKNSFRQAFHVQYAGMSNREIRIDSKLDETLIVSQDGESVTMSSVESLELPLTFTVTAKNDDFELISLGYTEEKGCYILPIEESKKWLSMNVVKGNVTVSEIHDNESLDRTMHLLALPRGIVDDLVNSSDKDDEAILNFLCAEVDGLMELKEDVEQYRMMTMLQDGVSYIVISPEAQWGVKITSDGTGYFNSVMGDTCYTPMKVSIDTYRGYELICADYNRVTGGYTFAAAKDSWLNVEEKQKEISISFKANESHERTLYLFALSLPIVEEWGLGSSESPEYQAILSERLLVELEDGMIDVNEDAAENYVIAKFIQEPNEANSMKVFRSKESMTEYYDVVKEVPEDQDWVDSLTAKNIPLDRVFHCSMKYGALHIINPLIPLSVWDPSVDANKDRIEVYGKSGKKYEPGDEADYYKEHGMQESDEGNYMLVYLNPYSKKITEDFIIYFIDNDSECLKALIVNKK